MDQPPIKIPCQKLPRKQDLLVKLVKSVIKETLRKMRNEWNKENDGREAAKFLNFSQLLVIQYELPVTIDMNNQPTNQEDRQ